MQHMPNYHVYCDFASSGSFSYTAATEITSDTLSMDIVGRGKNLLKQQAEAAKLSILLNNTTHKYTPSFTATIKPGKYVWALMGYPVDTFSGMVTNDTLTNRVPTHDSTFAAWSGDTASWVYGTAGVAPSAVNKCAVLEFVGVLSALDVLE